MKLITKFSCAFKGLFAGFKQPSILFQVFWAAVAITVFAFLQIDYYEWLTVIVMIALVWLSEWVNSLIEKTVDYISLKTDKRAEEIKDLGAGLVLLAGFFALVVGLLILAKYLL